MRPVGCKRKQESGFVKVGTGCKFARVDIKRRWNIYFFFTSGIDLQYATAIIAAVTNEICNSAVFKYNGQNKNPAGQSFGKMRELYMFRWTFRRERSSIQNCSKLRERFQVSHHLRLIKQSSELHGGVIPRF